MTSDKKNNEKHKLRCILDNFEFEKNLQKPSANAEDPMI